MTNRSRPPLFNSPLIVAVMAVILAVISTSSQANTNPKQVQSRALLLPDCPSEPRGANQSILGGLLKILIPPLTDSAVDSFASMLKRVAEPNDFLSITSTQFDFYQVVATDSGEYAYGLNTKENCLVIAYGTFGGSKDEYDDNFAGESEAIQTIGERLWKELKLSSPPLFYLEARIVPSTDGTAFQLRPLYIHYPTSLANRRRANGLIVGLTFKSTSNDDDAAFANISFTLSAPHENLTINDPAMLSAFNTDYIDLPTPNAELTAFLAEAKEIDSKIKTMKATLKSLDLAEGDEEIARMEVKKVQSLLEIENRITNTQLDINDIKTQLMLASPENATLEGLEGDLEVLKTKLLRQEQKKEETGRLYDRDIAEHRFNVAQSPERRNLPGKIVALENKRKKFIGDTKTFVPVNLSVSLAESAKPNKLLLAVAEAIENNKDKISAELQKPLLTGIPRTDEEREADELQKISDLAELNQERVAAAQAIFKWKQQNNKVDTLTGFEKADAEFQLRLDYLDAKLKCDTLEIKGEIELECLSLEA